MKEKSPCSAATTAREAATAKAPSSPRTAQPDVRMIKCVVWDLDNTLWHGNLLEGDDVELRPGVMSLIRELDRRGILHSIASRNDRVIAIEKLHSFDAVDYFLHPQIGWGSKVTAVESIAKHLDIGLDSLALVDDDEVERAEVGFAHPEVRCYDPADLDRLLLLPSFTPGEITSEAANRRRFYLAQMRRTEAESNFAGPKTEFLASLNMHLTVRPAHLHDLPRVQELTRRTNQLNSTGYTYSKDQLEVYQASDRWGLFVASLDDRFGSYGMVGVALVELKEDAWDVKLLLTSCRVMSRGVGGVVLALLANRARARSVRLRAEFVPTPLNRLMHVALSFAGFRETGRKGDLRILECELSGARALPGHMTINSCI
jgi:FkbH-like protein